MRISHFVLLQGKQEIESTIMYKFIDKTGQNWYEVKITGPGSKQKTNFVY